MSPTHDGEQNRRIDRLESRVDKHDDRIGALGGVVGRLTGEVEQHTARLGRHATQLDALEQADRDDRRERFKGWLTFASAVIVALIGAYVALKTGAVGGTK
jgi:hypothetical protein